MKTTALGKCLFMFLLLNCCKGNIYCQPLHIKEVPIVMNCCTGYSIDIQFKVDPILWKHNLVTLDTAWGHGNLHVISKENIEQINDSILVVHCPYIFQVGLAYTPKDEINSLIYHVQGTRYVYEYSAGRPWQNR
jgi:hypothetical protein